MEADSSRKTYPAYSQKRKVKIFLGMTHETAAEVEQSAKQINTKASKTYTSLLRTNKEGS